MLSMPQKCDVCYNAAVANGDGCLVEMRLSSWLDIIGPIRNEAHGAGLWSESDDIETLVHIKRFCASATCFAFLHHMHSMPQKCDVCYNAAMATGDGWLVEMRFSSWLYIIGPIRNAAHGAGQSFLLDIIGQSKQ